jgi:decaprenylphospho-beta-D-ribofuranose 2-oxidase
MDARNPEGHPASLSEPPALRVKHIERVEGWGMAVGGLSHVFRPVDAEGVRAVFDLARSEGRSVGLRGGGNSYGDAAMNTGGIVLDLSRMDKVLAWDRASGLIDVEPGVTIERLWKTIIGDGWWPSVVSGTMFTTMGGCAAMNIHGKNNYKVGTFGDQVVEFDLITPAGDGGPMTVTRESDPDLFHGAISGFGMLGCFTRLRLQTKRVHSGLLRVEAFDTRTVGEMIESFEERAAEADYLVGWIDCIKGGRGLGRGIVHRANYLAPGEDPDGALTLAVAAQGLPDKILGLFPKSLMHLMLRPFCNNLGMRLINAAKFHASVLHPRSVVYLQSHTAFAFLLDYVPNWKFAYKPGGLIQYQSFIPKEAAESAFEEQLRIAQGAGLPPYLGVFKKHRPDPFLLSHAVDGYSLALDFRVTRRNRVRLWHLAEELDRVVLDHGGRFYFAKDATLRPDVARSFLPPENLKTFAALKRRCDPENLLQTDLSRRLFGPDLAATMEAAGRQ